MTTFAKDNKTLTVISINGYKHVISDPLRVSFRLLWCSRGACVPNALCTFLFGISHYEFTLFTFPKWKVNLLTHMAISRKHRVMMTNCPKMPRYKMLLMRLLFATQSKDKLQWTFRRRTCAPSLLRRVFACATKTKYLTKKTYKNLVELQFETRAKL